MGFEGKDGAETRGNDAEVLVGTEHAAEVHTADDSVVAAVWRRECADAEATRARAVVGEVLNK